jgi:two-component system chemotaxis sensor kinase CheA
MDASKYTALFLAESREHLSSCNQLLLEWERDPAATGAVAGLFRSIHTLKGMAATMGFARLAELAHRAEDLLDAVRGGRVQADGAMVDLLFRAVDGLEAGLEPAAAGRDGQLEFGELGTALEAAAGAGAARPGRESAATAAPEAPTRLSVAAPVPGTGRVVRVKVAAGSAMPGVRAVLALKRAEALGTVSGVQPPAAQFEQEGFAGEFVFRLDSPSTDAEIEAALRAAGEIGSVEVSAPTAVSEQAAEREQGRARHIRVDLRRLDALMNQIGELAVARGRLQELVAGRGMPEVEALATRVGRLVGEMQTEIIQARMTPVWQTFDRFPRLVRDLARQLNKRVRFEVEGEGIELDRAILDEIGDPLLHLIRNSIDHGIESPAERKKAGKPAEGRVLLQASQARNSVAIRVSDDGRGVDRAALLAKAKREGVVEGSVDQLTDDLLLKVLARPGFSTAKEVTDVSGRGVGIDVVVSRIRQLGGAVEVQSVQGQGTAFTLRLPMTLAVVRVLLAKVGTERYALPLTHVAETVEVTDQSLEASRTRDALVVRDRVIPTRDLRQLLAAGDGAPPARRPGIILEVGERRAAVLVDGLVGQQEIVVEPFEAPRGTLPVFSGAAILGDGVPALILDAAALV